MMKEIKKPQTGFKFDKKKRNFNKKKGRDFDRKKEDKFYRRRPNNFKHNPSNHKKTVDELKDLEDDLLIKILKDQNIILFEEYLRKISVNKPSEELIQQKIKKFKSIIELENKLSKKQ